MTLPRQPLPLLLLEGFALVAWLVLVGLTLGRGDPRGELVPISPEALTAGGAGEETWMGIYFQGQKVGYAVSSETPTLDGGLLLRDRAAYQIAAFGEIKRVVQVGNAVVDPEGVVRRFDLFIDSSPMRITARGEVHEDRIVVELVQAGELQTIEIPIDEPPQMGISLGPFVASLQEDLALGQRWELPYFDPITQLQQTMTLKVVDIEILPGGDEAWWIERSAGDFTTRMLVTPGGDVLREEMELLGMARVRQTPEEAMSMPVDADPVDIIALSSVKLVGGALKTPRKLRVLELEVTGVEASRLAHQPPEQVVSGNTVRVSVPLAEELPTGIPTVETDPALAEYLAGTVFIPVDHREIKAKAAEVVDGDPDRARAVKRIVDWVFDYLIKAPTISVPNALEVLRVGQGDCNEHTSLAVALMRASGIPARIAAGLVWSERIGGGAFYYHAWPEVYMGPDTGCVPVDPTFGQVPADATHIKVVEGDLDKQVEIMGVMGRIGFTLVEAR